MTKAEFNEAIDESIKLIRTKEEDGVCYTLKDTLNDEFSNLFEPAYFERYADGCHFSAGYWLRQVFECDYDDIAINRRLNALEIFRYNCLTYGTYKGF